MTITPALDTSTPSFSEFDPSIVPFHADVYNLVKFDWDYRAGVLEGLMSGGAGSAKSLLMAHLSLDHLMTFPRSRCLIGRKSMPDLRDTIFTKILEHIEGTVDTEGNVWKEGVDFGFTRNNCAIWLKNGSEYVSRSWADKNFKKLGSLDVSIAIIEELAENDIEFWDFYKYIKTRVGRLPHVPVAWILAASNPDGPEHPAYDYFQIGDRVAGRTKGLHPNRRVWFSLARDNPFLPDWYVPGLLETLDPLMAMRLVDGLWVAVKSGKIYHAYSHKNFREGTYQINPHVPIYLSFDFNIGAGKPMSACFSQVRGLRNGDQAFCFFGEAIVHGADTAELMEEIAGQGILEQPTVFIVHGDATGASKSTKSKKTDYDIIREFLANYRRSDGTRLDFEIDVPKANPPIRTRHNLVNGYCRNALGRIRFFVYKACKLLDKGMRLVAPKEGASYLEDDRPEYQHVTTAAGYHVCRVHSQMGTPSSRIRTVKYR